MRKIFIHFFLLSVRVIVLCCLILFSANTRANTVYWQGSGAGGSGIDLSTPSNWGVATLSSADDYVMTFSSLGTSVLTISLTQSSALTMNSLTIVFSDNNTGKKIINISVNSLTVIGSLQITNSCGGSSKHEIDFNVSGTNSFGSVSTIASGNKSTSFLFINVSTNATLTCNGNWSSSCPKSTSSQTSTTIENSGNITISGSTTAYSSGGGTIVFWLDKSPAKITFAGSASFGDTALLTSKMNATLLGAMDSSAAGTFVFKGDVIMGKSMGTDTLANGFQNGIFLFDAVGSQTLTSNANSSKLIYRLPGAVIVGSSNNPTLSYIKNSGPNDIMQVYDSVIINGSSTLAVDSAIIPSFLGTTSSPAGSLKLYSTATLKLVAAAGQSTSLPDNFATYSFATGSTVEYAGADQTVFNSTTYPYGNLTFSGSGTKTAGGSLDINGNVVINSGVTFSANGAISVAGNWTNNGTYTANSNNVTFDGSSGTQLLSGSTTFYTLTLDNTGAKTDFGTSTITIDNKLAANNGTMRSGKSLIIFTGSSGTITGVRTKNFYNLQINSGAIITHNGSGAIANNNLHVSNSFVNNGTYTEGTAYTFYFDSSAATETISGSGTTIVGNLVIGDITNSSLASTINCSADIEVSGSIVTFYHTSTFNATSGTVKFSTSATCTIAGPGVANFYNVTVANNVILSFDAAIAGQLSLKNSGNTLSINGNTLTLNGTVTGSGTITGSSTSSLSIGGSGTLGTLSFTGGAQTLASLTVNRSSSGIATLGTDLTVATTTTLTNGAFEINGNTLTLNGTITALSTGTLSGSSSSALVIGGTASSLFFTQSGTANYLKTFTLNSSSSATLGNALNIAAGTYASPGTLTANGNLATGGYLTLKSDTSGDARIANSSGKITDTVTVERFIPARRAWRFLTVPFSGTNQTINQSWQEGYTNSTLQCPTQYPGTAGYGTEITYNGVNGYDLNVTSNPSIKVWSNGAWAYLSGTNNTNIAAYPAYCLFVRGDRQICLSNGTNATPNSTVLRARGVLNEKGTSISNIYSGSAGNWVFIGNPFASPIDITNILNGTGSSGFNLYKMWVWDPKIGGHYGVGAYVTYTSGVWAPINGYSSSGGSYPSGSSNPALIQSGQSFMVQLSSGSSSASITFQQSNKDGTTESNVNGLQAGNGLSSANDAASLKASSQNNARNTKNKFQYPVVYANLMIPEGDSFSLADGVAAVFSDALSKTADERNAQKNWNTNENMTLVRNGQTFAIEFRPRPQLTDTMFFRLYLFKGNPYALQIFSQNIGDSLKGKAWLIDNYLNTRTQINLADTSTINFQTNTDTNSYRNRFMLVYNKMQSALNTSETQHAVNTANINLTKGNVNIYPNPVSAGSTSLQFNNMSSGEYTITVYNANGEALIRKEIMHSGGNASYPLVVSSSWAKGLYTVHMICKNSNVAISTQLIIAK